MKVLVTGRLPDQILEMIRSHHQVEVNRQDQPMAREALLAGVADKEGVLCMITDAIDQELLAAAPRLKIIANCGVGFNHIDVEAATARGIPVANTPGVLTDATADLTFALILASGRRLVQGDRRTRAGEFRDWAPLVFLGHEISGKTLGIVGLGRIGKAVARRAQGFEMKVLYHNRNRLDPSEERSLKVQPSSFETLMRESDYISVHVPLTSETRHLIGAAELALMKPSAFLINTSRGPVVDEKALVNALQEERIAGAGLDVYENEPDLAPGLKELKNAILLPHIGSATIETRTRMAMTAAQNLLAGLRGEVPPDCLNCVGLYDNG